MKRSNHLRSFLLVAGSSLLALSSAHAATWGGGTSAAWATGANWGGTAPANSGTADIANFNLGTYGGNPVYAPNAGTTSIAGITIGASNGAMTLTTTNLTIGSSSGISIANGAGAFNINGTTTIGVTQTWTNNSTNLFTFGAVTATQWLDVGGSGNSSASGIISGGGGLTRSGTGKLTIGAANTYTGDTTVNGGTLAITGSGKIYSNYNAAKANQIKLNSGGTIEIDNWLYGGSFGTLFFEAANFVINGGTLKYVGTTANGSANRSFKIGASGATLESATSGQKWTVTSGGPSAGPDTSLATSSTNLTLTGVGDGQIDQVIGGALGLTKSGNGTWTLGGTNSYTGVTTLTGGTLSVGSIGNGGIAGNLGQAAATADRIVFNGGTLKYTGASSTSNRAFTINAGKTATIETANNISFAGATGAATTGALTKTGAGKLTLDGVNTYTGTTTISQGTLALGASGSIASSSMVIVGTNTTFDVSAVTGGYNLGGTQTLSGSGTVVGGMTISGTLSPGNSPGIQATGSQTWVNGGDYNFQMLDATGAAGTGFDQIQITGTLDLTSLTAGGFNINLWSLSSTGPDVNGNALNFNNAINQSWTILTTSGGISGFQASDFAINVGANNGTGGFSNALGGGSFSIDATSSNLVLNFTAVPEPGAGILGGLGMLMLLRRRRSA